MSPQRNIIGWLAVCALLTPLPGAELTPATRQTFDRYVGEFEAKWIVDSGAGKFLTLDSDGKLKAKVRGGQSVVTSRRVLERGLEIKAPGGMIQDWVGAIFLPQTTLAQVRSLMQDYQNYRTYFKPEVIESRVIQHQGDEFEVFLRLYKKHVLTAVLNTTYSIRYSSPDRSHLNIVSRSTRIAEVSDPDKSMTREEPLGHDSGFLWALNSYWRFEDGDGGVYAECEAISLSRDVPFGLGWAIKGFLDKFPKESMENTLAGVKRGIQR